jgi:hypothetical protein
VSRRRWARIVAAGAVWAVVYNLVWGIAWFAFMRLEWLDAMAAIKEELPFTPPVWDVWVALTLPIGVAAMAYLAGRPRSGSGSALSASLTLWLPLSIGTFASGVQDRLSVRVLALDAMANLVAMLAASFAGRWILLHVGTLESPLA